MFKSVLPPNVLYRVISCWHVCLLCKTTAHLWKGGIKGVPGVLHKKHKTCFSNTYCCPLRNRYLVLCLGGMQTTVKAEVERHLATCGQTAEVRVFEEDCRGTYTCVYGRPCASTLLQVQRSTCSSLREMRSRSAPTPNQETL